MPAFEGQPLPLEMTLAQLLTLLYERKLPQGYQSISLAVKLGSRVISDSGLSKTDSFKRLRTEKGRADHPGGGGGAPLRAALCSACSGTFRRAEHLS